MDSLIKTARRQWLKFAGVVLAAITLASPPTLAEEKTEFRLAWSIYVGWMPWDYAARNGIVQKWADKYGIKIDVVQINDYVESINQYTAGQFDACVMTNMDALTIPAAGGVDSTALIVGDFSNGNDGIVLKGAGKTLPDIKGQKVNLVELSVSHYLLARALQQAGLSEKDVKVVNTSDADMVAAFETPQVTAVVTWNPLLAEIAAKPDTTQVFDSKNISGEILDLLVVNTEVLQANPKLGKALAGAWYETMALMSSGNEAATTALTDMAAASGTDLAGFKAQLASTRMFYQASEAVGFVRSDSPVKTMDAVRKFSFEKGLLGEGATSADVLGIAFPGGQSLGDNKNIKLRFDDRYMGMAAEGTL